MGNLQTFGKKNIGEYVNWTFRILVTVDLLLLTIITLLILINVVQIKEDNRDFVSLFKTTIANSKE